jgi:precorrin-6B methylase 2
VASLPHPIKKALQSKWTKPIRRVVASHTPMVTGTISYEGHAIEFTAPVDIFDKAKRHGIENRICRLMLAEIPVGGTAVDVGANYGFLTRIMAAATGQSGHVLAFEADPAIADTLRTALDASGSNWVEVVGRPAGTGASQAVDSHLPSLSRVDFLKIDVDGPELDVLESSRQLLERDHPVVVVEINRQAEQIHELLITVGYTHFMGMSNEPLQPGTWPPNLIASTRPVAIPPRGV